MLRCALGLLREYRSRYDQMPRLNAASRAFWAAKLSAEFLSHNAMITLASIPVVILYASREPFLNACSAACNSGVADSSIFGKCTPGSNWPDSNSLSIALEQQFISPSAPPVRGALHEAQ